MDAATIAKTQGQALTQQEWLKEIALHLALLEENVKTISPYLTAPVMHIDADRVDPAELERISKQLPGRVFMQREQVKSSPESSAKENESQDSNPTSN